MGKKLVIKGADFSANGIKSLDYVELTFGDAIIASTGEVKSGLNNWTTTNKLKNFNLKLKSGFKIGALVTYYDNDTPVSLPATNPNVSELSMNVETGKYVRMSIHAVPERDISSLTRSDVIDD